MDTQLTPDAEIEGVLSRSLQIIRDERGAVLHMLRVDSAVFKTFGEVYFSEVNRQVVKAWKRHRTMTQHFAVPVGKVKFVIYDNRPDSKTTGQVAEYVIGRPENYRLLVVPPMLWYGFQGLGGSKSIIANCTDIPYSPEESEQADIVPGLSEYVW